MVQEGIGKVSEVGLTSRETVSEEESYNNGNGEKRGRGRPAGSLNKPNGSLSQLKSEVEVLTAKVASLQEQISRQAPSVQLTVPLASSTQLEKRVSVIQSWVENFHQFLLTSRITNSADRAAEEELALIMEQLPENVSISNAER